MQPVAASIHRKVTQAFAPVHLEVINESHMHSVPTGSESHFKLVLVSASFEGKRAVQRHQAVYACLAEELQSGVHALALHTYTPAEWQVTAEAPASPQCMGGGKSA
jgi:stress-induced morphogen